MNSLTEKKLGLQDVTRPRSLASQKDGPCDVIISVFSFSILFAFSSLKQGQQVRRGDLRHRRNCSLASDWASRNPVFWVLFCLGGKHTNICRAGPLYCFVGAFPSPHGLGLGMLILSYFYFLLLFF